MRGLRFSALRFALEPTDQGPGAFGNLGAVLGGYGMFFYIFQLVILFGASLISSLSQSGKLLVHW